MILADKILSFLDETGEKRNEFAERADVPLPTLNAILSGRVQNPTYFTALQLAKAAEISLDEIGGLISKDMGAEEIARIKKIYEKNEESLKAALAEYNAQIAHKEETEAHDKEIIRRQDLRIHNLENTIKSLEDRVVYQKQAIRRHIIAVAILLFVIVLLVGFIISIYLISPTKNIFA